MEYLGKVLCACAVCVLLGCGGAGSAPPPAASQAPSSAAKPYLEDLAQSGEVGSNVQSIREALEDLKATDPAKAEKLLSDLDELMKLPPDQVKVKAKAMADEL